MKVVKAMKKLKFWSRKKKKKKSTHITDHHPPPPARPPPPCPCCHSWVPVQPSAPPLPLWFEYDHTQISSGFGLATSSQAEFTQEEIVPELSSHHPTAPVSNTSYQQYIVPNPVYGVPVLPSVRRGKKAGFFGCVVNIGRYLIRCFCPCFGIQEVD